MQKMSKKHFFRPIIILNFKVYIESGGRSGERLSAIADKVAKKYPKIDILICPHTTQLAKIASIMHYAKVYCQSADSNPAGKFTGSIPITSIKDSKASGTLLNHAENQLTNSEIEKITDLCKENSLNSVICANNVKLAKGYCKYSPWAIAVEIPELIGSGISVSNAKPEVVIDAVAQIKKINSEIKVLVGAGVSTEKDVKKCLELKADGVLLASGYVLSKNPELILEKMARALNEFVN